MARLTGRRVLVDRYLVVESVRAAHQMRAVLPIRLADVLVALHSGAPSSTPHESLSWARDRSRRLPEPPKWLGTIRPISILLTNPRGLSAPPTEAHRGQRLQQLDRVDGGNDEPERSRILDLFVPPVQNPFAAKLKKLFGSGKAPDGPRSVRGPGGDESPVRRRLDNVGKDFRQIPWAPPTELDRRAVPIGFRYPSGISRTGSIAPTGAPFGSWTLPMILAGARGCRRAICHCAGSSQRWV